MEQNPIGKVLPLERPKMKWEDTVKTDVEALRGEPN